MLTSDAITSTLDHVMFNATISGPSKVLNCGQVFLMLFFIDLFLGFS